jgi:hypothetical protein
MVEKFKLTGKKPKSDDQTTNCGGRKADFNSLSFLEESLGGSTPHCK